jgi:hypothetical protein
MIARPPLEHRQQSQYPEIPRGREKGELCRPAALAALGVEPAREAGLDQFRAPVGSDRSRPRPRRRRQLRSPPTLRTACSSRAAGSRHMVMRLGRRHGELAACEIDRDDVVRRLGGACVRRRMILDPELLLHNDDAEVAKVLVVVILEPHEILRMRPV